MTFTAVGDRSGDYHGAGPDMENLSSSLIERLYLIVITFSSDLETSLFRDSLGQQAANTTGFVISHIILECKLKQFSLR